jgi:hypothetical protein
MSNVEKARREHQGDNLLALLAAGLKLGQVAAVSDVPGWAAIHGAITVVVPRTFGPRLVVLAVDDYGRVREVARHDHPETVSQEDLREMAEDFLADQVAHHAW